MVTWSNLWEFIEVLEGCGLEGEQSMGLLMWRRGEVKCGSGVCREAGVWEGKGKRGLTPFLLLKVGVG